MNIERLPLAEVLIDWALWPRYEAKELSHIHIMRLKAAYETGADMPLILVDKESHRIVDGIHRDKALNLIYPPEFETKFETKVFHSDKEMLLESARRNSIHGLPLSSQDKVHCFLKLRRMKVSLEEIAEALNMTPEGLVFLGQRVAVTKDGEKLPLSGSAATVLRRKMDQQKREGEERILTDEEEKVARGIGGNLPIVYARFLITALRGGVYPLTDVEKGVLQTLKSEIIIALRKYEG